MSNALVWITWQKDAALTAEELKGLASVDPSITEDEDGYHARWILPTYQEGSDLFDLLEASPKYMELDGLSLHPQPENEHDLAVVSCLFADGTGSHPTPDSAGDAATEQCDAESEAHT